MRPLSICEPPTRGYRGDPPPPNQEVQWVLPPAVVKQKPIAVVYLLVDGSNEGGTNAHADNHAAVEILV